MELSEMKSKLSSQSVANVEFRKAKTCYPRLHGKNAVKTYHGYGKEFPVVILSTCQGVGGWGFICHNISEVKEKASLLVGKRISDLFSPEIGILDDILTPFDIALHDLAGNILGLPVAKMLNPSAILQTSVYDGAIYMNDIIPEEKPAGVEAILRDCEYDWNLGYRTFKVKIGRGYNWMGHDEGLLRDIQIVQKIHEAFPGAGIMVDANNGYSVDDAISFMEGIEGIPLYWFEEPFNENQEDDERFHHWLDLNRPRTMIADGENKPNIPQLLSLAANKVIDVIQPDICGYGFTKWRKLMNTIVANGYLGSPHAWGDIIKTYYCGHLAAAFPHHIPCIEGIIGYTEGVEHSGYSVNNGILTIPDKPGFGMDFVWGAPV